MENVGMNNGGLMAQIQVDTMKKAMDIQAREILSALQSAASFSPQSLPTPPRQNETAKLTGLGASIDIKV